MIGTNQASGWSKQLERIKRSFDNKQDNKKRQKILGYDTVLICFKRIEVKKLDLSDTFYMCLKKFQRRSRNISNLFSI